MLDTPDFIMKDKRESSASVGRGRGTDTQRECESYNKDPPDIQAALTCSVSPRLWAATQPRFCLLTHLQTTKGSRCGRWSLSTSALFRHTFRHELRRADRNLAHIAGSPGVSKEKHLRPWGFPPGVSAGWSRPMSAAGQTQTRDGESKYTGRTKKRKKTSNNCSICRKEMTFTKLKCSFDKFTPLNLLPNSYQQNNPLLIVIYRCSLANRLGLFCI